MRLVTLSPVCWRARLRSPVSWQAVVFRFVFVLAHAVGDALTRVLVCSAALTRVLVCLAALTRVLANRCLPR